MDLLDNPIRRVRRAREKLKPTDSSAKRFDQALGMIELELLIAAKALTEVPEAQGHDLLEWHPELKHVLGLVHGVRAEIPLEQLEPDPEAQ